MKRIKRLLTVGLLVAALLSAGSAACAEAGSEPITLSVMNWQFSETGKGDQLRELLKRYAEANNVVFEEISIPWGQYPDTLFTKWAAQDAPDIVFLSDAILEMAVSQEYVLPLSDAIDFEKYADTLSPLSNNVKFNGKYYGFVSEAVVQELIFMPDMLVAAGLDPNAPPTTVDEFIQAAVAVKNASPDWMGYGCRNSMDQSFGWWSDYCSWSYGFGARWAVAGTPTINSPENVAALTAYKRMYDSGGMSQGVTSANYRKAMSINQNAFATDSSALIHYFLLENPDLNIKASALPFPEKDSVTELVVVTASKDAKHPEEALKFIEWFMQPDVYIPWMEEIVCPTGAYIKSVSDEWLADRPYLAPFVEGAKYANVVVPEGLGLHMGEIRDSVLRAMEQVLLNDMDPEEALTMAQEEVEILIQ